MKQVSTEVTPEISGGAENPQKNPPIEVFTPICPSPIFPEIPGPIVEPYIQTTRS